MTKGPFETEEKNKEFARELSSLCNRYSLDVELNIPDFLIAEYLISHIESHKDMMKNLRIWRTH
jgi:hypothetical protein